VKYLLDTNVVAEATRASPRPSVLRRLAEHTGAMAIASPTWHELVYGVARMADGRRESFLRDYIEEAVRATLPIVDYDARAAEWHANERARLAREGKPTAFVDGQIAAIAAVNDLVLVTANTRHFVPFRGIPIEDWASDD
jgi:tRNA(fMet)-specific endonuclease VapC